MNIDQIIEMMEELLDNSTTVPFSSKKLIDCDQMRDHIDNISLNLPPALKKAEEIERNRSEIIEKANKEADEIRSKADEAVEAAKARAREIMSESEISRQAKEYAAELIRQAKEQADEIIADARKKDSEIRKALTENLNESLSQAQAVLEKNLESVTNTMSAFEKLSAPAGDGEETAGETNG